MCAKTSDTKRSEVNSEQQQNNIIIHIPTTRIRYEKIKQLGEGGTLFSHYLKVQVLVKFSSP